MVSPADFIPLAEEIGLIVPLEYSLAITNTPSTHTASWLNWNPAPRISRVGSSR